jgi:hypothetical protein
MHYNRIDRGDPRPSRSDGLNLYLAASGEHDRDDAAKYERAYRRGVHQGLALAVELVFRADTHNLACQSVLKAQEIAAECRRLGAGESSLIDAINAAVSTMEVAR